MRQLEQWLSDLLGRISPIDVQASDNMHDFIDQLLKPVGSLGRLESLAIQLAGIQATLQPEVDPALAIVFAGDHGVSQAGVSRYPQEVTMQMLAAYDRGVAALSVLGRQSGIDVRVVDVGVKGTVDPNLHVIDRKVSNGTHDFRYASAMTDQQCNDAIKVGCDEIDRAFHDGYRLVAMGEVGIGNTTSAAALASALLQEDPKIVTGHGTGVDDIHWKTKIDVVRQGLNRHLRPGLTAEQALVKLGGLEVAALVGAILKSAERRMPILLDGFTTGVAALVASRLAPNVSQYCMASHQSAEPGHQKVLGAMGWEPLLNWNMRLGEASGAAVAFPLVRHACAISREMATFQDAGVAQMESQPNPRRGIDRTRFPDRFPYPERRAVYRAIASRRDIRQFRSTPIADDLVSHLLHAAHHGPSVGYSQPWDFILIRDHKVKVRLKELAERERTVQSLYYEGERRDQYLHLKLEGLVEAPLVIVVTADGTRGGTEIIGRHSMEETTLYSVACAIQNLWLAARAEGVAVGWVSLFEKRHLRDLLRIPAHIEPVAVLCVGYTDQFPAEPLLKTVGWSPDEPLDHLLHFNDWLSTLDSNSAVASPKD